MRSAAQLLIADGVLADVRAHLLPPNNEIEQAAFGFAHAEPEQDAVTLRLVEWLPIMREGFDSQPGAYLELRDGMSGQVIKRAHDLGASLVEFHCHTGAWPAMFSASDLSGFEEFVPHVWWRLKQRPYAAVVVTADGFDGLAWIDAPDAPVALDAIQTPTRIHRATLLTMRSLETGRYVPF